MPLPGPEFLTLQQAVAGRFALVRELGRGGMGVVFLARDLSLDRLVAIKLLPPHLGADRDARERFLREARTAAGLSHPHIVPIHLVEQHVGLTYFVMAYVEGETLGARVRRAGPLPASEAMRVIQEVAWALAHAHAHGVTHRDVKPDNVLLDAASGRAMVSDFGIARSDSHATPAEGVARGTPAYASPEVLQGAPGDARSDLYSLGVTAWMAAAGRTPFERDSVAALALAHVHAPAPSLSGAARVPARFAAAVDRCLAKDPADRFPSAEAFAVEVDAARARGPGVPPPVRAFLREWEGMSGEVGTAGTAALVAIAEAIVLPVIDLVTKGFVGFDAGILSWIFVVVAVITAGLAKARLFQLTASARAMLRSGFSLPRISAAQMVEDAERAEERVAAGTLETSQRRNLLFQLAGSAIGTIASFAVAYSELPGILIAAGAGGAVALPTLAIRLALRLDADTAQVPLASRMLRGRLGRWVFRLAGVSLPAATVPAALEGPEPTALALGQAARDLWLALPAGTRDAIAPDLPDLVAALEQRALRARVGGGDANDFSTAVTALEAIRLDLLRVSVRQIEPSQMTAELDKVRAMGDAIERRLAAEREVSALLHDAGAATPRPAK